MHGQPTRALVDANSYAERHAKGLPNRAQEMRQCDLPRQNTAATGSALLGLWPLLLNITPILRMALRSWPIGPGRQASIVCITRKRNHVSSPSRRMLDGAGSEGHYSDAPTSTSPGPRTGDATWFWWTGFAVVVSRYPHKRL